MEVRKGYISTFYFECKICGSTSYVSTENEKKNLYLPINQAIMNDSLSNGRYVFFGNSRIINNNRIYEVSALIGTK